MGRYEARMVWVFVVYGTQYWLVVALKDAAVYARTDAAVWLDLVPRCPPCPPPPRAPSQLRLGRQAPRMITESRRAAHSGPRIADAWSNGKTPVSGHRCPPPKHMSTRTHARAANTRPFPPPTHAHTHCLVNMQKCIEDSHRKT